MFYRIKLSSLAIESGPSDLPAALVGLAPSSLADLSSALDPCPEEFEGAGYWLAVPVSTFFDPGRQRLSSQMDETPDPASCTVIVTPLVVNLTPAEIAERDALQLASARADKVAAINAERDRRYDAGFTFEGHIYQIDVESRTDMLAIEAKLNRGDINPHGGFWRSAANVMVPMDDAKVAIFIGAVGDYVGAIKARSWALKDAALAGDPVAVDALAGWP